MMHPTSFSNLADLSRLPWFSAYDDRVILSDKSIGPIIDMHTHVALAYVRPMQLDLYREHPRTEHYLPTCCPLDLGPYSNRNFPPAAMREMKVDLSLRSLGASGMRRTHTVPNMVREMDEMGVERSVLLPIDFPVLSHNATYALDAGKRTERMVSFGSVHPYSWDVAGKLDAQAHRGARGIKVHPAVQGVRPDDARAMKLYRMCGDRNLIVLWHCGPVGIVSKGADHRCQVRFYEKPIAENPKTTFVLGHAGALQFEDALALVKKYPNVYLEISSQGLHGVRRIVESANADRITLGSDWPFYHAALPIAKVLIATEGKRDLRRKVLYENAARLLQLPDA